MPSCVKHSLLKDVYAFIMYLTCKCGDLACIAVLSVFLIFFVRAWSWLNKPKYVAYFILLVC